MLKRFLSGSIAICFLLILPLDATRSCAAEQQRTILHFSDAQGTLLAAFPLCQRGCFAIRYIHSVARSPVEDWFYADGQTIFLEKTIYQDFGAGLPHSPEPGQSMRVADGRIIITGYHQPMDRIELRVGRIAQHTLMLPASCHGEEGASAPPDEIPLSAMAAPGSTIVLSLHRVDALAPLP